MGSKQFWHGAQISIVSNCVVICVTELYDREQGFFFKNIIYLLNIKNEIFLNDSAYS